VNSIKKNLVKNITQLGKDLVELCMVSGPSSYIAKSGENDIRIDKNKEFPVFSEINKIVKRINDELQSYTDNKVHILQDFGSIILTSGFRNKPTIDEIKNIPIVFASHADEISYMVKQDLNEIVPLFNAKPIVYLYDGGYFGKLKIFRYKSKILGFRGIGEKRELIEIGEGEINIEVDKRDRDYKFFIENITLYDQKIDVKVSDLVIQNYNDINKDYTLGTIIHAKALDDRVGAISQIYALKEFTKINLETKAIIIGDQKYGQTIESSGRSIRNVFNRYCNSDDIVIITDAFDGRMLKELEKYRSQYLDKALIVPFRSDGKGSGDLGFFSIFRDEIINVCKKNEFDAITTTDYVSRSIDYKIQDMFSHIISIDWSNGPIIDPIDTPDGPRHNICNVDESIQLSQLINVIGTLYFSALYFSNKLIKKKPLLPNQERKKVFISYSWDNEEHKEWVRNIAKELEKETDIKVELDQWDLELGEYLTEFMDKIAASHYTLIIITQGYLEKIKREKGGVKYEKLLLDALKLEGREPRRNVVILKEKELTEEVPPSFKGKAYFDMIDNNRFKENIEDLIRHIKGIKRKRE